MSNKVNFKVQRKSKPALVRLLHELFYKIQFPVRRLYWYVFHPTVRGAQVFVENNGRILLVHHGYGKKEWHLPGGGVKRGETFEAAGIRETAEETGVSLKEINFLYSKIYNRKHKKIDVHYFSSIATGIDLIVDGQEISDAGWFDLENLPSQTSNITKQELKIYYDQ